MNFFRSVEECSSSLVASQLSEFQKIFEMLQSESVHRAREGLQIIKSKFSAKTEAEGDQIGNKWVEKFLESSPRAAEIFQLLEGADTIPSKDAPAFIAEIMEVFAHLLLSLAVLIRENSALVESGNFIWNNIWGKFRRHIYGLLSSGDLSLKVACLCIMRALVNYSPNMCLQFLKEFNFSDPGFLRLPMMNSKGSNLSLELRRCYVEFALTFLNHKDPEIVTLALSIRALFSRLFKHISHDEPCLATRILHAFIHGLIKLPGIPGSSKFSFFSNQILEPIISLAEPSESQSEAEKLPDPFDLLETLIQLHDKQDFALKHVDALSDHHKALILRVLKLLKLNLYSSHYELSKRILLYFDDLIPDFFSSLSWSLEGRISFRWMMNLRFLIDIWKNLDEKMFVECVSGVSCTESSANLILRKILPVAWSKSVLNQAVLHKNKLVKIISLTAIEQLLIKVNSIMTFLEKSQNLITVMVSSLRQELFSQLYKQVPNIQTMINLQTNLFKLSNVEAMTTIGMQERKSFLLILDFTLRIVRNYQDLFPFAFIEGSVDCWKLIFSGFNTFPVLIQMRIVEILTRAQPPLCDSKSAIGNLKKCFLNQSTFKKNSIDELLYIYTRNPHPRVRKHLASALIIQFNSRKHELFPLELFVWLETLTQLNSQSLLYFISAVIQTIPFIILLETSTVSYKRKRNSDGNISPFVYAIFHVLETIDPQVFIEKSNDNILADFLKLGFLYKFTLDEESSYEYAALLSSFLSSESFSWFWNSGSFELNSQFRTALQSASNLQFSKRTRSESPEIQDDDTYFTKLPLSISVDRNSMVNRLQLCFQRISCGSIDLNFEFMLKDLLFIPKESLLPLFRNITSVVTNWDSSNPLSMRMSSFLIFIFSLKLYSTKNSNLNHLDSMKNLFLSLKSPSKFSLSRFYFPLILASRKLPFVSDAFLDSLRCEVNDIEPQYVFCFLIQIRILSRYSDSLNLLELLKAISLHGASEILGYDNVVSSVLKSEKSRYLSLKYNSCMIDIAKLALSHKDFSTLFHLISKNSLLSLIVDDQSFQYFMSEHQKSKKLLETNHYQISQIIENKCPNSLIFLGEFLQLASIKDLKRFTTIVQSYFRETWKSSIYFDETPKYLDTHKRTIGKLFKSCCKHPSKLQSIYFECFLHLDRFRKKSFSRFISSQNYELLIKYSDAIYVSDYLSIGPSQESVKLWVIILMKKGRLNDLSQNNAFLTKLFNLLEFQKDKSIRNAIDELILESGINLLKRLSEKLRKYLSQDKSASCLHVNTVPFIQLMTSIFRSIQAEELADLVGVFTKRMNLLSFLKREILVFRNDDFNFSSVHEALLEWICLVSEKLTSEQKVTGYHILLGLFDGLNSSMNEYVLSTLFSLEREILKVSSCPSVFKCQWGLYARSSLYSLSAFEFRTNLGQTLIWSNFKKNRLLEGPYAEPGYIPTFTLPFFLLVIEESGHRMDFRRYISHGCLSYVIMCLALEDTRCRQWAYEILFLVHKRLSSRSEFLFNEQTEIMIVLQFLQNSATEPFMRFSSSLAVFFSRAILILMNPSSTVFRPLYVYLLSRTSPSFETDELPMWFPAFFGPEKGDESALRMQTEIPKTRSWILETMASSINSSLDHFIYSKSHAFEIILHYSLSQSCPSSDRRIIYKILRNAIRLKRSFSELCGNHGLLTFMGFSIRKQEFLGDRKTAMELLELTSALLSELSKDAELCTSKAIQFQIRALVESLFESLPLLQKQNIRIDFLLQVFFAASKLTISLNDVGVVVSQPSLYALLGFLSLQEEFSLNSGSTMIFYILACLDIELILKQSHGTDFAHEYLSMLFSHQIKTIENYFSLSDVQLMTTLLDRLIIAFENSSKMFAQMFQSPHSGILFRFLRSDILLKRYCWNDKEILSVYLSKHRNFLSKVQSLTGGCLDDNMQFLLVQPQS